ncbi:hypothetical protein GGP85_003004 [Salinibacter ruber]|uniref:carboxypeptidase-like regulatory domain-containing protein n=1 Tax=Salinibacter ruber TaxID=146919 RepID=UPI0021697663|nr:carboxypeptidase-like regulatory domain-containing protein [Salinibacter ruber]MCS3827534.1 hypothetical protein [Salinibacter ruber]
MQSSTSRVWFVLALFSLSVLVSCDSGGGTPEPDEPSEVSVDVTGTVTSAENDEPIGDATVEVLRADNGNTLASATTDTTGSYEATFTIEETSAPDQLSVRVSSEGFLEKEVSADFQSSVSRNVSLEEVEITEVTASGLVNRSDTGDPVTNATVTGSPAGNSGQLFETTTNEAGEYEVTFEVRVPDEPDEIAVGASAEDFEDSEQTVSFGSEISADLSLSPSEVTVTTSGTITAELDDSTVEGAEVSIFRAGENSREPLASTTSEMGGAYEVSFSVLAPDSPGELRIEAKESRFADASLTAEFSETVTQDIPLPSIEIATVDELQAIQTDSAFPLDGFYVQTSDIDATETSNQNGGAGFDPIGDDVIPFSGRFEGNGFVIEGLSIDRPDKDQVGLFGEVGEKGLIKDVILEAISVRGKEDVGGLAGRNKGEVQTSEINGSVEADDGTAGGLVGSNSGKVEGSEANVSVSVTGNFTAGGLIGNNDSEGRVRNSSSIGNVSGRGVENVGGLVGWNQGYVKSSEAHGDVLGYTQVGGLIGRNVDQGIIGASEASVKSCVATGDVSGTDTFDIGDTGDIGGLVGENGTEGKIQDSRASGDVSSNNSQVGGLVGVNSGAIQESKAVGNVSGEARVGGFVGIHYGEASGEAIASSYATGSVSGGEEVGGFVGVNTEASRINKVYATGPVSGNQITGGLAGTNVGSIDTSFWNTEATSQSSGVGRGDATSTTGLTTSEMQGNSAEENMGGLDFQNTWRVVMGDYPALQWEE